MEEIRKVIENILNEIDDEIVEYQGDNLIEDGLIDSFAIVTMLSMIEDRLHVIIKTEDVKEKNFKSIETIIDLVNKAKGDY